MDAKKPLTFGLRNNCFAVLKGIFLQIGPCDINPCQNYGTCTPNGGNFECACHVGFTGTTCESGEICCFIFIEIHKVGIIGISVLKLRIKERYLPVTSFFIQCNLDKAKHV